MRAQESVLGELEEDLTLLVKEWYHVHQHEKVFLREYVPGATEGSTPVGSVPRRERNTRAMVLALVFFFLLV
jgi:hypothetical protein